MIEGCPSNIVISMITMKISAGPGRKGSREISLKESAEEDWRYAAKFSAYNISNNCDQTETSVFGESHKVGKSTLGSGNSLRQYTRQEQTRTGLTDIQSP